MYFLWKYIYKWKAQTKYSIGEKGEEKKYFNRLQEVMFPQFFSCFECKYVLIALTYRKKIAIRTVKKISTRYKI